jgi:hypothetical protein
VSANSYWLGMSNMQRAAAQTTDGYHAQSRHKPRAPARSVCAAWLTILGDPYRFEEFEGVMNEYGHHLCSACIHELRL